MVARVHLVAPLLTLKPFNIAPTRAELCRDFSTESLLRAVTLLATERGSHPQNCYVRGWARRVCDAEIPFAPQSRLGRGFYGHLRFDY